MHNFPLVTIRIGEAIVIHPAQVGTFLEAGCAVCQRKSDNLIYLFTGLNLYGSDQLRGGSVGDGPIGEGAEVRVGYEHRINGTFLQYERNSLFITELFIESEAEVLPEFSCPGDITYR